VKLVAGVDIGNSTTEVVVADVSVSPPHVVSTERAPTRGRKGSAESGRAAAALLARAARRGALEIETVFLTPQRPVHTGRIDVPESPADLGRLTVLSTGASTPAGSGSGVGRPVRVESDPATVGAGPLVLVAEDPLGFRGTAAAIVAWQSRRSDIAGVLLAGDEATLVAARLERSLPVADCVDPSQALACDLIALEVAGSGQLVTTLADPLWLVHALELELDEQRHAVSAAAVTRGHRDAVIGRLRQSATERAVVADRGSVRLRDDREVDLPSARSILLQLTVPAVRSLRAPGGAHDRVDDLWLVDLTDTDDLPGLRAGTVREQSLVVSSLAADRWSTEGTDAFAGEWSGAVEVISDEGTASRRGSLTTPGASPDAWVLDLGGGTVDLIDSHGHSATAAGSGELMTAATRHALAISGGAAEWVKRGPASRVDAPHVVSDESGERRFLGSAAPHGTVGWLVVRGPSGQLPFSRTLSLAEWRSLRLSLKRWVFADNLTRLLAAVDPSERPSQVVVTGGPAGDDELLEALAPTLRDVTVGRARVAGTLDHRWAVAYGLVLEGRNPATAG